MGKAPRLESKADELALLEFRAARNIVCCLDLFFNLTLLSAALGSAGESSRKAITTRKAQEAVGFPLPQFYLGDFQSKVNAARISLKGLGLLF